LQTGSFGLVLQSVVMVALSPVFTDPLLLLLLPLLLPLLLLLPLPPEDAFPPPEPAVPPADVSVPDVVLPFPVPSVVAEPVLELLLADAPLAKHMISPVAEMEHPIWFILSLFVSLLIECR